VFEGTEHITTARVCVDAETGLPLMWDLDGQRVLEATAFEDPRDEDFEAPAEVHPFHFDAAT
jgi:hypothetical protein